MAEKRVFTRDALASNAALNKFAAEAEPVRVTPDIQERLGRSLNAEKMSDVPASSEAGVAVVLGSSVAELPGNGSFSDAVETVVRTSPSRAKKNQHIESHRKPDARRNDQGAAADSEIVRMTLAIGKDLDDRAASEAKTRFYQDAGGKGKVITAPMVIADSVRAVIGSEEWPDLCKLARKRKISVGDLLRLTITDFMKREQ